MYIKVHGAFRVLIVYLKQVLKNPIKLIIWIYIILLIFEGALRKWILPGLADVLLIARDPFVILLYAFLLGKNRFPQNNYLAIAFFLAIFSMLLGFFAENSNIIVTIYGVRINYLHLPLLFIIGQEINRNECIIIGRFFLLLAIPMTVLLVAQFLQPQSAWINRNIGGMEGGGIMGALGHYRPPGTFSYITGIAALYPLVTAFFLFEIMRPKKSLPGWLLVTIGAAIVVAIPISISRLVALSCLLVIFAGIYCFYKIPGIHTKYLKFFVIGVIIYLSLPLIPGFNLGVKAFSSRWEIATGEGLDGIKKNIVLRQMESFIEPLTIASHAPLLGHGIGMGSNVGSKFLTGKVGFALAEGEWAKCILELGPVLGFAFITFRIWLFFAILTLSLKALKLQKNPLPILLFAASSPLLLYGQWGPPTIQGFAMLGSGLVISSWRIQQRIPTQNNRMSSENGK